MDYRKYTLNEEHRRMFQLMGLNENIISEQDEKEKIKDLKDAIKRERKSKRQEKRADRKKARQQKRVLKKFEQLCSKYPDSPECADKDKFISVTYFFFSFLVSSYIISYILCIYFYLFNIFFGCLNHFIFISTTGS